MCFIYVSWSNKHVFHAAFLVIMKKENIFSKKSKKVLTNAFLFAIISNVAGTRTCPTVIEYAGVAQWQSS